MSFQKLSVAPDGHHLIQADGTPFFYLADTAWELFHKPSREDALFYLDDRAAKGFTAIQAVALAERDGLRVPNAYGRCPLGQNDSGVFDPCLPDPDDGGGYWQHVDFVIAEAAKRGLYIALLPTWGDKFNIAWGAGPEIFTPENAYQYGHWLGSRYRVAENIIWVLGGDRPLDTRRHFDVVRQMALGLRAGDGGAHLMTFHPTGGCSSAKPLHEEAWLDFNMIQSGHTRSRFNADMIAHDYALNPPKPVVDGEPGYEDHPESFNPQNGYMDAADVRQFAYMALFSGACGHTYGDHSIWVMAEELPVEGFGPDHFCLTWRQALGSPGAGQMRHAKELLLSHDFLSLRPRPDYIENPSGGVLHIPVLEGENCLMAYTAQGKAIRLKPGALNGRNARASWFDPRVGAKQDIGEVSCAQALGFAPPSGGRGNDWVLLLECAKQGEI